MTDEQWKELTHQLKVPLAGRKSLEALLFEFQERTSRIARIRTLEEFAGASKENIRPSDERKKLMRAAKLASELLDVLDSLESISYGALLEPADSEACMAIAKKREWEGKVLTLPLERPSGEDPQSAARQPIMLRAQ